MGYAEFRHHYTRDEEFRAWFAQLEHDILALLEESQDVDEAKESRLPRYSVIPDCHFTTITMGSLYAILISSRAQFVCLLASCKH
jgi:hypothetical protein